MEVAEIRFDCIQHQDTLPAPLVESLFGSTILDGTVEHLADEHRHRVLQYAVAYSYQGTGRGDVPCRVEIRL